MADFEVKTVSGVEIFAAGTWTDAFGITSTWEESDLDAMVKAFKDGQEIALKVGHTSDIFNLKLAADLGVPLEMIIGEFGMGAMGLGKVDTLVRSGDKLVADFKDVPEPLANLIEGGSYDAVSVELKFGEDGTPIATGVALLGAEEPAVDSLAPLDVAEIFSKRSPIFAFSNGNLEIDQKRMRTQFADDLMRSAVKIVEKKEGGMTTPAVKDPEDFVALSAEDMAPLWEALGLGQHSDMNSMLEVIEEFKSKNTSDDDDDDEKKNKKSNNKKSKNAEDDDEDDDEKKMKKSKNAEDDDEDDDEKKMQADESEAVVALQKQIDAQSKQLAKQDTYIEGMEHDKRVAKFAAIAESWTAIPGTAEEFGKELAGIEESAGEKVAEGVVSSYSKANEATDRLGVLIATGSARAKKVTEDSKDEFEQEIRVYAKEKDTTYEKAVVIFSQERGAEFDAWHQRSLNARED